MEEEALKKYWVINMNSKFKKNWDFFIMTIAIFNCLTIPFGVAFDPPFMRERNFTIINYLIDFVFLIDLVINCRTTLINSKTGEEVKTPKGILIE
jgi:hypothetical protein